jgi:ribonuclease P protein component
VALKKEFRIVKNKDIQKIIRFGKKADSQYLRYKFVNNNLNHIRVLVITPKKIFKKSVNRHKFKRKIEGFFNTETFAKTKLFSFDLIIMTKNADSLILPFSLLKEDFRVSIWEIIKQTLHKKQKNVFTKKV